MKKDQEQKQIDQTSKKIQKLLNDCHKKINNLINDKGILADLTINYKTFESTQQEAQK